jgi:hypothetical protein
VLISLVSLAIVLYFADLNQLAQAVLLADFGYILLALLLMLLWLAVRGMFWRTLLQEKARFSDVFWTLNEGYLISNLLPFRLGEIARAFILSRKAPISFWEVLSTIVLERVMDLTLAVGVLAITLPFVVGAGSQIPAAGTIGVLIILVFVTLFLLARNRERAIGVFNRIGERIHLVRKLGGKIVPSLFDGLAALTDARRFLRAVCWVVLNWLIAIAQYFVLLKAFVPQAQLLWSTFSLGVSAIGLAAPSSPGAVGVFEAAMVAALALFSINTSVALAAAITAHVLQYLVTGALGIFGLIRDGESLFSLYRRIQRMQTAGKSDF